MDLALENGAPIIGLSDSGGARIQEGVVSLGGYADIFLRNTLASGVVPQLSLVMGPCAGGAVYSPAITDFIVMVEGTSYMFVTGPNVVKTVTHEEIDFDGLGGARIHNETSGVAHSPGRATGARTGAPDHRLPAAEQSRSGPAPTPGLHQRSTARRSTRSSPIHRSSPMTCTPSSAGSLTLIRSPKCTPRSRGTSSAGSVGSRAAASESSRSSPRCWPGSSTSTRPTRPHGSCAPATASTSRSSRWSTFRGSSGVDQEHHGIIRHGAKLLYAYCEATVPKITIITRKAYGGAYDVMSSKHVRGDLNYAWPTAEIAVMGVEGAVNIIFREEIAGADDPAATRERLVAEYEERFANPYAAARGYVDEVIMPSETRARVAGALRCSSTSARACRRRSTATSCSSGDCLCARTPRCRLPSAACSSRTGARSRSASSAPAASWASRRSPSTPTRTPMRSTSGTPMQVSGSVRPRQLSRTCRSRRSSMLPGAAARRPSIPATASSRRTARSLAPSSMRVSSSSDRRRRRWRCSATSWPHVDPRRPPGSRSSLARRSRWAPATPTSPRSVSR